MAKDSSSYAAVIPPGSSKPEYLKWIERGTINLYEKIKSGNTTGASFSGGGTLIFGAGVSSDYKFWYVSKAGGPPQLLKSNYGMNNTSRSERKKMFKEMVADDPELDGMFTIDNEFDFKSLLYYVQQYNVYKVKNSAIAK